MKKILFVLLVLLAAATVAFAVPALPGTYKYKQPDGTIIVLQNHGDEFFNWKTDADGNTVEKDADGFYRVAFIPQTAQTARYKMARSWNRYRVIRPPFSQPPSTNFGTRKVLCFIANFASVDPNDPGEHDSFVLPDPNQHFWDMLNKSGYSYNEAIGSVKDYFLDNSGNQYDPVFDVYGPVTLDHVSAHYDKDANGYYHVHEAILETYQKLVAQGVDIPLGDYDTDQDGNIDMVLFYYPGYNEAEYGPEETIWPHQSTGYFGTFDGTYRLVRYFCTSELRGNTGNVGAGIGTTCHEFSHALGLPDFYDVDYAENGRNWLTTGDYDLMSSGNYNDEGRRPPYLSAVERKMLGWMEDDPTLIADGGNYVLQGVQNNQAFQIDSHVSGEFFILECRDGSKWDSGLEPGILIYHVDRSNRIVGGGRDAIGLWNDADINMYGGHPCYYLVPPGSSQYTFPSSTIRDYSKYIFPGSLNARSVEPLDWDQVSTGLALSGIAFANGQATFTVSQTTDRQLYGFVKDVTGAPVPDVMVVLSRASHAFEAPAVLSTDQTCVTDAEGYYSFTLAENASEYQVVSTRMDGYVPQAYNVKVTGPFTEVDFVLMAQGQAPPATLKKYDDTRTLFGYQLSGPSSIAVGVHYTAAELAEMGAIGSVLTSISFASAASRGESVYLVVDIGNEMALRQEVTSQYQANTMLTFDVSDQNIVIPEGKDLYVGYGYTPIYTASNYYPILGYDQDGNSSVGGGNYVIGNFLSSTSWQAYGDLDYVVSAMLSRTSDINFATYGVSFIKLVDGVPQVVPAAGKTVYSVTWYVDETAVNGTPPAVSELTSGGHTYKAVLQHYDGTTERVYYDVNKE